MVFIFLVPRGDTNIQASLPTLQLNFDLHDSSTKELLI